ncbi:potential GINS DNA replication initiation complex subunit [Pseudozyma hubeiensis SY62]|uniref:DNA replication complex GINS protein PSF2 n=1 Tax=Pseudozyma hubeiensis (strain SY62) TaxID=1305764 RepID=R9PG51_PSEHS|nr:potential GINS DNA replication initiation complex subunit [Pseudozyma hubeiensis SY62]GAC97095.1 potential GINS DNA replication initiation complex subunit [Pseudozyma hubeiensis SY62]
MSSSIASTSALPGSVASTSISVSSYIRGASATDLDLATTSLSSTSITIVPLTSVDRVRLLSGIYGPFRPPTPATVPLWVAVHLKKRKKAVIVTPTWLTVESLTETLKHETTQPGFSSLPHYWIGVSQALLSNASDDVPNSNRVRALLKDIREARQSKILSGVPMINSVHLQMHNISAHEVAELRGFFGTAFAHLKALRPANEVDAEGKLQSELDARNRWLLMPSLPTHLGDESMIRPGAPSAARDHHREMSLDQDESMNTNYTDESSFYAGQDATRAQPRKSNVSDSGYHSAPRADRSTSPSYPRQAQPSSSGTNRPPRFAVDDEDDDS